MPLRPVLVVLLALSSVHVFAGSKAKSIPNQSIDQIVAKQGQGPPAPAAK